MLLRKLRKVNVMSDEYFDKLLEHIKVIRESVEPKPAPSARAEI